MTAQRLRKDSDWRGTYRIRPTGRDRLLVTGTITGAFESCEEAENAAILAAKVWIDQHAIDPRGSR